MIEFDPSEILTAQFGVGQKLGDRIEYSLLPADETVQYALIREVNSALSIIGENSDSQMHFDPAEKYAGNEYVVLPLQHELAVSLAELHKANNLPLYTPEFQRLKGAFCYFLRATDGSRRRITALNRASQFKTTLGRQGRLMVWASDSLRVIPDPVMQLNVGFDIVIDSKFIHIFHPASFRTLGNVEEEIAKAVPRNIEAISRATPYVNWGNVEEYATTHPRAASLLSSIRTNGYTENLDKAALKSLCENTGVEIDESGGQIAVQQGEILAFLEVIDRRRYEIGLVPNTPEQYRASSRSRLGRS